jgi:hypothetical protein
MRAMGACAGMCLLERARGLPDIRQLKNSVGVRHTKPRLERERGGQGEGEGEGEGEREGEGENEGEIYGEGEGEGEGEGSKREAMRSSQGTPSERTSSSAQEARTPSSIPFCHHGHQNGHCRFLWPLTRDLVRWPN